MNPQPAEYAPPGPRWTEFTTSDPEIAREFLHRAYGAGLRLRRGDTSRWRLAVSQCETGQFALADVRSPADLRFTAEGGDFVLIGVAVEGAFEFASGKDTDRFLPGDVFVANQPGPTRTCRTVDAAVRGVTLPTALIEQVAATAPGSTRLTRRTPMSAAAARQWKRTADYAHSVLADPNAQTSQLVIGGLARLLAATTIAVFPTDPQPDETAAAERVDATSTAVRRATAHIESYPDFDLSVGDVAAAARVSVRSLQLGFRRHLDTTPMAYLRRVRLDRAHADLLAADPGDGATVTSIAARWGFAHAGRFATAYRRSYGRSPSETLRA